MCVVNQYRKFRSNKNLFVGCEKQCPLECRSIRFNMEKSFATFPSNSYAQVFANNHGVFHLMTKASTEMAILKAIKQSMLSLKITFKEIEYTLILEQASLTIIDLIINMGGTLGLLLGISVWSFIKLAEISIKFDRLYLG